MKRMMFLLLIVFSLNIIAEEMNMDVLLNSKLDKTEVAKTIDRLQAQGLISEEEAKKAKAKLSGMSQQEIDQLHGQAVKVIKENPEVINDPEGLLKKKQ